MPSPMSVTQVGSDWLTVSCMCRPPANAFNVCWAYRVPGGVTLTRGDSPDWTNGAFTHWLPASLRNTAFCEWVYLDHDRPAAPSGV